LLSCASCCEATRKTKFFEEEESEAARKRSFFRFRLAVLSEEAVVKIVDFNLLLSKITTGPYKLYVLGVINISYIILYTNLLLILS
jgi:hypothetical protein